MICLELNKDSVPQKEIEIVSVSDNFRLENEYFRITETPSHQLPNGAFPSSQATGYYITGKGGV